ncbi:OB-fold putative lipoprotein [Membranihabitans maritimus]|uniref:OB-fold putative lipoprotein n=1 Tax=Membranihabitans maritimus TaxID=2904244 RepID=UPI001F24D57A|nr:OB-fold putative lipoprotein [Membranihabitans maritimus]
MRKIFVISLSVLLIGAIIAFFVYTKVYNKPHKDLREATADYVLSTDELINEFKNDEQLANKKYLDKVVRVKGTIQSIDTANGNGVITLRNGNGIESVICNMDPVENQKVLGLEKGQTLEARGICTGFLLDVMLIRTVIVN